jgi:hypothetical protein
MSAKPGELKVHWSKRAKDIMYSWGGEGACRGDGNWLNSWLSYHKGFESNFLQELENRGYDVTTLKISVKQKK